MSTAPPPPSAAASFSQNLTSIGLGYAIAIALFGSRVSNCCYVYVCVSPVFESRARCAPSLRRTEVRQVVCLRPACSPVREYGEEFRAPSQVLCSTAKDERRLWLLPCGASSLPASRKM